METQIQIKGFSRTEDGAKTLDWFGADGRELGFYKGFVCGATVYSFNLG